MTAFTTSIHLIASGNDLRNDLPYLQKIMETIYKNHAIVARDWLGSAIALKKRSKDNIEKADWINIVEETTDALRRADLVISEITLQDFNQGIQTYMAAQYKKPTLVVTRSQLEGHFISGISNKYLTIKQYKTEDELESLITAFIKQNTIPQNDLRFNMILDRRIYRYLRDKTYESGKNKSEIVREVLERAMHRYEDR